MPRRLRRAVGLALWALLLALAAPAGAAVSVDGAPGRVVLMGLGEVQAIGVMGDGSVILAAADGAAPGLRVVWVRRDGTVDRDFGAERLTGATVSSAMDGMVLGRIVDRGGGRSLLLAGGGRLVGLDATGTRDRDYGGGDGVAQLACVTTEACPPGFDILPGGGFAGTHVADGRWFVHRWTLDGALDPGFGQGGVAEIPLPPPPFVSVVGLPDGAIGVVGRSATGELVVARLLADGRPDPAFTAGVPFLVTGLFQNLGVTGDGRIAVLTLGPDMLLQAVGRDGAPAPPVRLGDPFDGGYALFPRADGTTAFVTIPPPAFVYGFQPAVVGVTVLDADGAVAGDARLRLPLGGGPIGEPGELGTGSGFSPGAVLARPDGSIVLLGQVEVGRPRDPEVIGLAGRSLPVVVSLSPTGSLDEGFGARATRARVRVAARRRRAALRIVLTTGPGACALQTTVGARTIASRLVVHAGGRRTMWVRVPRAGRRAHRGVVRVRCRALTGLEGAARTTWTSHRGGRRR